MNVLIAQDNYISEEYFEKKMGLSFMEKDSSIFRFFSPRSNSVHILFFDDLELPPTVEFTMTKDSKGIWEYMHIGIFPGKYYAYKIDRPMDDNEFLPSNVVVADPFSRAVAIKNTWRQEARTVIANHAFDWSDDSYSPPANPSSLIVYECHVRDMTAHPTSAVADRGKYLGFIERKKNGGFSHLKELGINAVELMPVQEFANIEPPYNDSSIVNELGAINSWNPYSRNHWGYMTNYFFAPESYYASDGTMEPENWSGKNGAGVNELKTMIKELHKENIAVIIDIVLNHVSNYDFNPLKCADKQYYFRQNDYGEFTSISGCGNDSRTEAPMFRSLALDCIAMWLTEYNVDGFRFDLATLIDRKTLEEITNLAKSIKPNVVLVAEPWGDAYNPSMFSELGWAAWNDWFRNGIKGHNPHNGKGFIFGKMNGANAKHSLLSLLTGTLRRDGGPFIHHSHSLNYLESHDDCTLGDFIRIAVGEAHEEDVVSNISEFTTLTPLQLRLHKLAAATLIAAQGITMIHAGQEFARTKIIATEPGVGDSKMGTIDFNSYNKDNETNYLNYRHKKINESLFEYYRQLFSLRKRFPSVFGAAALESISFLEGDDDFFLGLRIVNVNAGDKDPHSFIVLLNGNAHRQWNCVLPKGQWAIKANGDKAIAEGYIAKVSEKTIIPPQTAMILAEYRNVMEEVSGKEE